VLVCSPDDAGRHAEGISAQGPAALRLVTYNVRGLPAWLGGASEERLHLIGGELDRLAPDVVLLQEVWTRRACAILLETNGWSVARTPLSASFAGRDGLATLSRMPIVVAQFHPFRAESLPDAFVNKGALKTTVLLRDGGRLNIWNVHLQCGNKPQTRARQIEQLAGWVAEAEDGQIADVVAGDFNCTPDSPDYERLAARLGRCAQGMSGTEFFVTYRRGRDAGAPARTLDYIFVRARDAWPSVASGPKPVFEETTAVGRLSDHLGVEVTLSFSPLVPGVQAGSDAALALRRDARFQAGNPEAVVSFD
jgi:endonuclease/exonuclease/phosphatase family metal-dependent hydrolase